ncbi:hypothetical protein K491DRAFT_762800 [Lophiostoma macrostomum CBS 122681]|uniref:Pal1-domain-containing protein n=1 Tax=Lophiostoma macrostomum CBS 122681 TaxID=1314788 RepID=A0A6A6SPD7_9PLEO|nr:hypothetical protein K491DRAFT_762800 [Lophiostoma macrostomum CBS 122681]
MATPISPRAPWARGYELPSPSTSDRSILFASGQFKGSQGHGTQVLKDGLLKTAMEADQEGYFPGSPSQRQVSFRQPTPSYETTQTLEGRASAPPERGRRVRDRSRSQRERSSSYRARRDSSGERRANQPVTPQTPRDRLRKPRSSGPGPLSEEYDYTPLSARSAGFESLTDFGIASPGRRSWFSVSNALCDEENPLVALKQRGHTRRRDCTSLAEELECVADGPVEQKRGVMKKAKNLFRKKKNDS